jgi:hypothetical protein
LTKNNGKQKVKFDLKGYIKLIGLNICFPYILASGDRIIKIIIIMGDRNKNFEDPMPSTRDIKGTNYHMHAINHFPNMKEIL